MALMFRTVAALLMLLVGLAAVKSQASEIEASRIAARLSAFVQIPTLSQHDSTQLDRAAFTDALRFLRQTYPQIFQHLQVQVFADFSLLLHWPGIDDSLKPGLFMTHYDVIAPVQENLKQWDYPPFSGEISDGFIFGRGTLDNKNAVIAWLEALQYALQNKLRPQRSLYFFIGHDAESGGHHAATDVARHIQQTGKPLAFVLDEGGGLIAGSSLLKSNRALALLGVAEKGQVVFELSVNGAGGHASLPTGRSAVSRLARALVRLQEKPMPIRIVPTMQHMLKSLSQDQPWPKRIAMSNLWLGKPFLAPRFEKDKWLNAYTRSTWAVTALAASAPQDFLPLEASAALAVQLLPGDSDVSVLAYLRDVIADDAISIRQTSYAVPPPESAINTPFYQVLESAVMNYYPDALVAPTLLLTSTSSRHFAGISDSIYRFTPVLMTSEAAQSVHACNERIGVTAMYDLVQLNIAILQQVASQ